MDHELRNTNVDYPVAAGPQQHYGPNPTVVPKAARGLGQGVIMSVDNATNPRYATVLVSNRLPPETGYTLPAGVGPFAAGGTSGFHFFYNNSAGTGGSIVSLDLDNRKITSITNDVSLTAPVPFYESITDHKHNGTLNPDGYVNPTPVNHSASETQNELPYPQNSFQVQGVINSDGNVISTEFPGQLLLMTSGNFAGYYRQLDRVLQDAR